MERVYLSYLKYRLLISNYPLVTYKMKMVIKIEGIQGICFLETSYKMFKSITAFLSDRKRPYNLWICWVSQENLFW